MKLPEAVRLVGAIDRSRIVYIEDYVLQYLKLCREKRLFEKEGIFLYGRRKMGAEGETCIVYGACQGGADGEAEPLSRHYEILGRVDMELWGRENDECQGIFMGSRRDGQALTGYYLFYDENEGMKEHLGRCYAADLNKTGIVQRLQPIKIKRENAVYIRIRIAVLCILAIICAMAVTTVNGYGKLNDFIQKAAYTGRLLEKPIGDESGE